MSSSATRRIDLLKQQIEEGAAAARSDRDKAHEARFSPYGKFTNWANIGHCNPATHYRPRDEAEVVAIIRKLNASAASASSSSSNSSSGKRRTVRLAGAGASPNHICFTNDVMIHMMEHMNKVISVDAAAGTITVQGGCTLRHLFSTLDAANLMIPCVPSFLNTTIAGCIGTGTHSSGIKVKSLHCFVTSMRVVTAAGEVKTISRDGTPAEWRHWTCHLGVLGAITEVTLQAERKTLWRRISAPISASDVHSVLAKRVAENEYYRFWWTPHTDMCFEATIRPVASVDDETDDGTRAGELAPPGRHVRGSPLVRVGDASLDKEAVGAIAAALKDPHSSHHLWDQHKSEQQLLTTAANRLLPEPVNPVAIQHTVLERALYAATFTPALQPAINQAYQKAYLSNTQEQYGNAAEVMAFDCLFRQHTAEWAIDASRTLEAFEAVRRIILNNNLRVHFPVEFRFVDGDDTTLSPCKGRATCYIGIVMFRPHGREAPDTPKFLELFSAEMARMGGRSHWAKYYSIGHKEMCAMYGAEDWAAFNAYRVKCDPNGLFVNEWFRELLA